MSPSVQPRRNQGTGSAVEIRPDVWRLRAYNGRDPRTGAPRQVRRTVKGKRKEAERVLRELIAEVGAGEHGGASGTFADVMGEWIDFRSDEWAPKTTHEARRTLDNVIRPSAIGSVPLRDLTQRHIDQLWTELRKPRPGKPKGLSPSSIRRYHALIASALTQAVVWGYLERTPIRTAPKLTTTEASAPTPEQARALIAAAPARLAILLRLAAETGMRRGELVALRWEDVDLEAASIRVHRSAYRAGALRGEKGTKSDKVRTVAMSADTVTSLRAWRAAMDDRAADNGTKLTEASYVFSSWPGCERGLNPDTVSTAVARLCKQLGMPQFHLHSTRHYEGSQMIAGNVDVGTAQRRLGHASATTTLDIYTHAVEEKDREAAELVAATLR